MRLGKPSRKSRGWKKAGLQGKPQHVTTETVIGQVSADLASTYFGPKMLELADEALERYAEETLNYEDQLRDFQKQQHEKKNETEEAQVDAEGSTYLLDQQQQEPPQPPPKPLYHSQYRVDELTANVILQTSEHFFAKAGGGWKVHANAAKFERMLDEKYGVFRPFITEHPEIEQFLRTVQRKYAMGHFSPFRQGPPPIPRSTAVILLFMLQRGKMRWEIIVLATLFFLVGLQPWALVGIVSLFRFLLYNRKRKPIGTMKRRIKAVKPYYAHHRGGDGDNPVTDQQKQQLLLQPVGTPLDNNKNNNESIEDTSNYDTMMIGHGASTLYAAALLSRAGRKVLVLSSAPDASGCLTFQRTSNNINKDAKSLQDLVFDVENFNIAKISRQQQLLAPALATNSDCQGGIRFAKVGNEADGYAFEILSIPGVGTDSPDQQQPFILKASGGVASLMEDTAAYLGDNWPASATEPGDSTAGQYVAACQKINASASQFYLGKVLSESVTKLQSDSDYKNSTLRDCSALLNKCFALNTHVRSLMAGIGMKGENIPPSHTSMSAHITNICNSVSEEGLHYPIGGPRALCHALSNVIQQNGGRVITGASAIELIFDESIQVKRKKQDEEDNAPCCVGVQLADGREVRFSADRYKKDPPNAPVVVSMEGFVQTFIRLLPDDIRTKYKVPRGIPALSERRPVVHIILALKGNANELDVTGADFYRLPGATIARDEVDQATGEVKYGEIGSIGSMAHADDNAETADTIKDPNQEEATENSVTTGGGRRPKKNRHVAKFETGSSWLHISFPSAKDPSFESRHGKLTTCVVTIEADDELVTAYDTKPKIFVIKKATAASGGEIQRMMERVKKDLFDIYPQLDGKIVHAELRGPFQKGLSHNPERYAARGVRADTPYPGLYVGGSDLTVGDSFSGATVGGWLVANAVCGYNAVDHLVLQKNITSDLEQFLEAPTLIDDSEDVAVPYTPSVLAASVEDSE